MKISELITALHAAKNRHGDLPVTTYGGHVRGIEVIPAEDGIVLMQERAVLPNELFLEFRTERSE